MSGSKKPASFVVVCIITIASLMREYRAANEENIHGDSVGFGAEFVGNYSENVQFSLGTVWNTLIHSW